MMTFKDRDHWMRAVLSDDRLTLAQRAVACRIALFLRIETGHLPFRWDCLQQALSCSRKVLATTMHRLEELGWVSIKRNGRYSPNEYSLNVRVSVGDSIESPRETRTESPHESPGETEVLKRKEIKRAATPQSFSEWDYVASDGVLFVAAQEIESWRPDYPFIADIRAAIRNADRWAMAKGTILPADRKAVLLTCLKRQNERSESARRTEAVRAEERQVEADRRERRLASRGRQAILP